ncbi:MAG: LytR C-terminal domain-containing protein [Spirochaetota bacterium]
MYVLYLKKFHRNNLQDSLTVSDTVTLQCNGLSADGKRVDFSLVVVLFPAANKGILYFLNPLLSFNNQTAIESAPDTISQQIGKHIPFVLGSETSAYFNLSQEKFSRLIDFLGGLNFYLDPGSQKSSPKFQRYVGKTLLSGEETIDLLKKPQQAIDYVERMNQQKSIFLNLLEKMASLDKKLAPNWLDTIYKLGDTNLSQEEFLAFFRILTAKKVFFHTYEAAGELKEQGGLTFLAFKAEASRIGYASFQKNFLEKPNPNEPEARIEILNGTEINGLAKRAKVLLNYKNFLVLSTDNAWSDTIQESVVINRSGNTEYAYRIAKSLKIKKVAHIIRKQAGLDVTVVLGENIGIRP